jgi:hypothetical protein
MPGVCHRNRALRGARPGGWPASAAAGLLAGAQPPSVVDRAYADRFLGAANSWATRRRAAIISPGVNDPLKRSHSAIAVSPSRTTRARRAASVSQADTLTPSWAVAVTTRSCTSGSIVMASLGDGLPRGKSNCTTSVGERRGRWPPRPEDRNRSSHRASVRARTAKSRARSCGLGITPRHPAYHAIPRAGRGFAWSSRPLWRLPQGSARFRCRAYAIEIVHFPDWATAPRAPRRCMGRNMSSIKV